MIHIDRAGAEDLETITPFSERVLRSFMRNIRSILTYSEERERIHWKLVERPNSLLFCQRRRDSGLYPLEYK